MLHNNEIENLDKQTNRRAGNQAYKQINRQTDKQTSFSRVVASKTRVERKSFRILSQEKVD
jgi:hypothetical protein